MLKAKVFLAIATVVLCFANFASEAVAQAVTVSVTSPAPSIPAVVVTTPGVTIAGNVSGTFGISTFPSFISI